MTVEGAAAGCDIRLNQNPPENFCRPSVDPMLRSLASFYGAALLTIILTGMGTDGQKGAAEAVAAGGPVVAQDEATRVVWGMAGAVATSGRVSPGLPPGVIGHRYVPGAQSGGKRG